MLSRARSRACSSAVRPSRLGRLPAAVHCSGQPPCALPALPPHRADPSSGTLRQPGSSKSGWEVCQARLTPYARAINTFGVIALICVLPSPYLPPLLLPSAGGAARSSGDASESRSLEDLDPDGNAPHGTGRTFEAREEDKGAVPLDAEPLRQRLRSRRPYWRATMDTLGVVCASPS